MLTNKISAMTENFSNTTVFDFSKLSDENLNRVLDILDKHLPGIGDTLKELSKKRRKQYPDVEDIIAILMEQMDVDSLEDLQIMFDKMNVVNPGAVISLILRVIAVELDANYDDHITDCPVVYYHSFITGKIHSMETAPVNKKAFKYFAAFRSQDDAVFAIRLAQAVRRSIYEQED